MENVAKWFSILLCVPALQQTISWAYFFIDIGIYGIFYCFSYHDSKFRYLNSVLKTILMSQYQLVSGLEGPVSKFPHIDSVLSRSINWSRQHLEKQLLSKLPNGHQCL